MMPRRKGAKPLCGEKGGKAGSVSLQSFFRLFRRSKMLCILLRRGIAVY